MNIFYLHEDPAIAASYHCDKHVIKMVLETAQMLSTAHRLLDGVEYTVLIKSDMNAKIKTIRRRLLAGEELLDGKIENPKAYASTHANHPCAVWIRQSYENYQWAFRLMSALNDEKLKRYGGKPHLAFTKHLEMLRNCPIGIPTGRGFSLPAQAMPDDCKDINPVTAYRNYYIKHKSHIATWKGDAIPEWFSTLKDVFHSEY